MKEIERSEKQQGNGWNTQPPGGRQATDDQESEIRALSDLIVRAHYDREAPTQPLRRPSDDDIVPPGRH
jgi:hypothetical protein